MKQYLDLMGHVLQNGVLKGDRTGTGTLSVFGYQMRFNLECGFPLMTTKCLNTKAIIHELLWFLNGDTNTKYLNDNGVKIWDDWADANGNLGPIYGANWRSWGAKAKNITQPIPKLRHGVEPKYLGVGNGTGSFKHHLGKTWEGMMSMCYDRKNISYGTYGAVGVHVCDRWLEFKAFAEDATKLPGYNIKTDVRKVLDKDIIGNGFVYSPDTCQWVTDAQNASAHEKWIYTVKKDGVEYSFTNINTFCKEHCIGDKNISDLWTGNKNAKTRHGFSFVSKKAINTTHDQISDVIKSIKENPDSRRHIVSAWNVGELDKMALPPCHAMFQFYVAGGKLSCQLYQRSGDIFLGVPFNIASYALLTCMIAQEAGLKPGEFIHTLGDAHIYCNHIEQAKEQLLREPRPMPTLSLNENVKSVFDFKYGDFSFSGYDPHPHIKAPIAV